MTDVQIDGTEQVRAGSITDLSISSSAGIALSKIAGSAGIILADGTVAMAAAFNAGSNLISNLSNGIASTDAVALGQVNALIAAAVTAGLTPISFQGAYSSGAAYSVNQVVSYGGGVYLCTLAGTGNQPDISPLYWALVYTGVPGVTGAAGARGSLIYVAAGAPGAIAGQINGDVYIDSGTANLYQLVGGTWTLDFTLTGGGGGATYTAVLPVVISGSNAIGIEQATTSAFGTVKFDGTTIVQNVSQQLSVPIASPGTPFVPGLVSVYGGTSINTTGPGNALEVQPSGVSAGTYSTANITVGADGRITSASNGVSPITYSFWTSSGTNTLTSTVSQVVLYQGSGAATFILPVASSSFVGVKILIKNMTTSTVTINTQSSQTLDGGTTYSLATQYSFVEVLAVSEFVVIGGSGSTVYSWVVIGAGTA